jgi:hypothetical protein
MAKKQGRGDGKLSSSLPPFEVDNFICHVIIISVSKQMVTKGDDLW